jgi:hypothetical protein
MVNTTNASRFGNTSINSNSKSTFIPRDEWNKFTQEQKDRLIDKRRQERMGTNEGACKPLQSPRQVNAYDVNDLVCIDDIIDCTIMNHEVNNVKVDDDNKDSGNNGDNALLAFMARQGSSSGDIHQDFATKSTPDKSKNRQATKSKLAPSTVQVGDTTYYLNKGETITFQGHRIHLI